MKLSKYTRIVDESESEVVIYNTINRGIISIEKENIDKATMTLIRLSENEASLLKEMEFLEDSVDLARKKEEYEDENTLIISLETLLACNLRCPYCYQKESKSTHQIQKNDLDLLFQYITNVYVKQSYSTLILKVLGGEPSIKWEISEYIINKLFVFCRNNAIMFKLMIDTNGTKIDTFVKLKNYDSILFTIPLTFKDCHNKNRFYSSGRGSYDDIIRNVNKLSRALSNCTIVLRYNIDDNNIDKFEEYIQDISSKLSFTPIISTNYTMNFDMNNPTNLMAHHDLITWRSSTCIDILVKYNLPVVIAPFILRSKCQYQSKYSLKIFSDGTVGACAMSFFDNKRSHISDIADNIDKVVSYWPHKNNSIFSDPACINCSSLFLCGGTYKIPCIKKIEPDCCANKDRLHIDLHLFFQRYMKYSKEGKSDLFVYFNENELYK